MSMNFDVATKEGLYNLNIHELRKLGSQVGVKSPSSLNKETLVEAIFSIVVGEIKPYKQKDRRGRPQKATMEDVGLVKSVFGGDVGLMKVASGEIRLDGSSVKTGTIVSKNGYKYARTYPFIEGPDDAIISKTLEKDYALREYDVIRYILVDNHTPSKEVGKIITINNCPVSEYEVVLNRLEKVNAPQRALKIDNINIKEGQKVAIKVAANYKDGSLSQNMANGLKDKRKVIRLCLEKEEKTNTDAGEDVFMGLAIDNVLAGLELTSKAFARAKEYICAAKNIVLIIDNFNSLVKIYEANYKNNAEAFIKRLLGLSGQYNNGAVLTIVCLADKDSDALGGYKEFLDKIY